MSTHWRSTAGNLYYYLKLYEMVYHFYRQQLCRKILIPHASPLLTTSLLSSSKSSFSRPRAAGKGEGAAVSAAS